YLACASVLLWRERSSGAQAPGSILLLLAAGYAPSLLVLALDKVDLPRRAVLAELAAGVALVYATTVLRRAWALRAAMLAIVAIVGLVIQVPFALRHRHAPLASSATTMAWLVNSTLYPLKVTEYRGWFDKPKVEGGGMTPVGDRYLLATGDGDL